MAWAGFAAAQGFETEGQPEPLVVAEEPVHVEPVPPLGYVDNTFNAIKKWFEDHKMTIGSGLSTSFQWDFNNPSDHKMQLRSLDNWHSRYYVGLWQMTLAVNEPPEKGDFGGLVQFDTGRISRRIKADWNGSGFVPDTDYEHEEIELQQAYVTYNVPIGNGLTLKGGKFVTLLGAEVIEPWLNPNYSRSFLFGFAIPFTHVGGLATYPITEMVSVTAGGVIGWDDVEDNNSSPSVIGQIALRPNDQFAFFVNGIYGPEQPCNPEHSILPNGEMCNSNKRGVIDFVVSMYPTEQLGFILNYDYGSEDEASAVNPGRHSTWSGFAGIITYSFNERFSTAVRGEWFQDAQGSRTGTQQTLWEATADFKAMLSDYIYVRTEYRHDESNENVFQAGKTILHPGQDAVALELGYYF